MRWKSIIFAWQKYLFLVKLLKFWRSSDEGSRTTDSYLNLQCVIFDYDLYWLTFNLYLFDTRLVLFVSSWSVLSPFFIIYLRRRIKTMTGFAKVMTKQERYIPRIFFLSRFLTRFLGLQGSFCTLIRHLVIKKERKEGKEWKDERRKERRLVKWVIVERGKRTIIDIIVNWWKANLISLSYSGNPTFILDLMSRSVSLCKSNSGSWLLVY